MCGAMAWIWHQKIGPQRLRANQGGGMSIDIDDTPVIEKKPKKGKQKKGQG